MSLHPEPIGEIPPETARVARSTFPKGSVVIRLRDGFGELYRDEYFRSLCPRWGQPGLAPWRLTLVTAPPETVPARACRCPASKGGFLHLYRRVGRRLCENAVP